MAETTTVAPKAVNAPPKPGTISFSITNNNPDKEMKLAVGDETVSGGEKRDFELEAGKHLDLRVK